MRFTKRLLALLLAFVLAAPALTYAVSGEENDAGTNILPAEYVDFHTEAQAGYISDTVESYWSYAQGTKDTSQPNPVICDIAGDGFPVQSKYVFQKSDNPEFENAEIITISGVKNGQYKLYNTELGEHFY